MTGHGIRHQLFALLLAAPALGASNSISGKYADLDGRAVMLTQTGDRVSVETDNASLPIQAREVASSVILRGPIASRADGGFTIDTEFAEEFQPTPTTKLRLRVTLDAVGSPVEGGLHLTSCEWKIQVIVFAGGEIAGSETKTQACVGLWKSLPTP